MAKPKREQRVKVWSSIHPDDDLKLEILSRRTFIPKHLLIRRAIHQYVADVRVIEPGEPKLFTFTDSGD